MFVDLKKKFFLEIAHLFATLQNVPCSLYKELIFMKAVLILNYKIMIVEMDKKYIENAIYKNIKGQTHVTTDGLKSRKKLRGFNSV